MRIVFMGTPDFAVKPLKALIESKHEVVAVVCQPDKPVGRKAIITECPVKVEAKANGIPVYQFNKIRVDGVETLKSLNADIMITCAYGQILSQEILDITKFGVLNIHASLLPKYRGAAPIQYAVINGDRVTGVTIMKTALGIDSGDIISVKEVAIDEDETAGELFDRLSDVGATLIVDTLDDYFDGKITPVKQDESKATVVKMLSKEDGKIDFNNSAITIKNLVRGLNPWPVAFATFDGKMIKIFSCEVVDFSGKSGEVLFADTKNGLIVACGDKAIKILEIQMEGAKRMLASDFILGRKLIKGDILGL